MLDNIQLELENCLELFPSYHYVNLENPEYRDLAETDPKAFFHRFPAPLILDEVQRVPHILSWIQVMVDESNHQALQSSTPVPTARFVLTGSHQLELRSRITQSLDFYRNYYRTYVEKDVRLLINLKDSRAFEYRSNAAGISGSPCREPF